MVNERVRYGVIDKPEGLLGMATLVGPNRVDRSDTSDATVAVEKRRADAIKRFLKPVEIPPNLSQADLAELSIGVLGRGISLLSLVDEPDRWQTAEGNSRAWDTTVHIGKKEIMVKIYG